MPVRAPALKTRCRPPQPSPRVSAGLGAAAWVALACWAGGCQSQAERPPRDLGLVLTDGAGGLHRCGTQRVLVLRGSGFEMGRQHGALLAESVRTVVRESLVWTAGKGLSRARLAKIYAALAPHIPPHYHDEMRGLAEGSGAPLRDIQLLHAMPSKFHCSGAAAARSMTRDGKLYHARSLDYSLDIGVENRLQNHALLIARFPTKGQPSVVPAWAGFLGAVTGMNLAGISIGEKGAASSDESFAGMPMIFTVREALRSSASLDTAIQTFRHGPRTCGFNFILGSGDERDAVALEVSRSQFQVFRFGDPAEARPPHAPIPDAVRRTNHYVHPDLAKTQPRRDEAYDPARYLKSSVTRYQRISRFLLDHRGRIDVPAMIEILRGYPKGHPCLHQAVMNSTDREIWIAQAIDDRVGLPAGAQNQTFYGYRLTADGLVAIGRADP